MKIYVVCSEVRVSMVQVAHNLEECNYQHLMKWEHGNFSLGIIGLLDYKNSSWTVASNYRLDLSLLMIQGRWQQMMVKGFFRVEKNWS